MENLFLVRSIMIFMAFWGLGILLLWFRPRIDIFWKIVATLIFAFYCWFFFAEISQNYLAIRHDWFTFVVQFLMDFGTLLFSNLFLFWPILLVVIFYKSDDFGAERLLKFVVIFSLLLWFFMIAYVYYYKGINSFMFDKLREMIPYAR